MNSDQFVYWLQGMFEVGEVKKLNKTQVEIIREHLKLALGNKPKETRVINEEIQTVLTC